MRRILGTWVLRDPLLHGKDPARSGPRGPPAGLLPHPRPGWVLALHPPGHRPEVLLP